MLLNRMPALTPRAARFWMTAYIARHVIGVALFVGLMVLSFALKTPALGYILLVLTPIYILTVVVAGRRMVRQYRRTLQQQGR